ncbi:uncharacterized protein LOC127710859 [Mytilus californianus]|uniref:uncharacterized protein LOC127710859 n=1 Tax=Mytilus californianus TaxID=6549 RepID=UPI00224575B6|nr:uncharacterized protein LOC127710859 [Mytilus californianus]
MPINQLFEPCNIRALAHDHDYLQKCPEDIFLNQFGLITMNDEHISRNEQQTRGQQANKQWHIERQKRLQSSNFGRICKLTDRSDPEKVALEIIDPKIFKSKATEYGKRYENIAIKEYERETECSVTDCGIFVSKHLPFLGSSPDGVVSDKVIVEVKCPFSARDKIVSASTVPYLSITDDILHLNHNHNYYYQVQGQLYCSNRLYCDFIVYTLCDSKCFRIMKDDAFIAQMLSKLHEFYTRYFKPAILKKILL